MSSETRIRQAILGVAGIAVLSKFLGFMREMVIAERFGTSHEYDILLIGIAAPIFFNLVLVNATNYLAVPFLSRRLSAHPYRPDWGPFWSLLHGMLPIVTALVLLVILAAPVLVRLVAPSLGAAEQSSGVLYCRLIAVLVLFGFLESYLRSALNVARQFAFPAAGTIILNVVAIAVIYIFAGRLSVAAILAGLLLGSFFQVLFLFLRLTGVGILRQFRFSFFGADFREISAIGGIVLLVEILSRSYFLIDRYFASDLSVGVVAALNYGSLLVMLPVSVAALAIASVTFPFLSDRARGNNNNFAELLYATLRLSLVVGIPVGLFYLAFARELTAAVFLRGAFDMESLELTSRILRYLVPHLICLFLYAVMLQACYASGRQKLVLLVTILSLALKIILTSILKGAMGYAGIALATSLAEVFTLSIMAAALAGKGQLANLSGMMTAIIRIGVAALPVFLLAIGYQYLPPIMAGAGLMSRLRVVPAFLISLAAFFLIGYILKIEEVRSLVSRVRGFFSR